MAEHGIQISVPLIAPLRDDVKTQTRRTVKGDIPAGAWSAQFVPDAFTRRGRDGRVLRTRAGWVWLDAGGQRIGAPFRCPYGIAGDRLWVREAYRVSSAHDALPPRDIPLGDPCAYVADGEPRTLLGKIRPGMFMPRHLSRFDLEVRDVRVQRLRDISEDDARAEGVEWNPALDPIGSCKWRVYGLTGTGTDNPISSFASLIDSINGDGTWESSPFVFVIEFRRIDQ